MGTKKENDFGYFPENGKSAAPDNWLDAAIDAGQPFDEKAYHERICKYEGQWWRERLGIFSVEPQGDGVTLAREIADKYRAELETRYRK